MQMVTRNVSGSDVVAGQDITMVSQTDGGNTIVVSGDYSSSKFFIGEKYTFTYEFSQQYVQSQVELQVDQLLKMGDYKLEIGLLLMTILIFKSSVTPKGRSESIDTFTGAIVSSATVNGVNLEDGDFTFAVQSRNDQLVIKLINDSYLPSNFVSAEASLLQSN